MRATLAGARTLIAEMIRTSPREVRAAVALLCVVTFTEGVALLLLTPLLELVGVVERNPMPRAAGWLGSVFALFGLTPTLASVLALFVLLAAARAIVQRRQASLNAAVKENVQAAYRLRLYRALAGAEWQFLATRAPADFAHALAFDIGRIGMACTRLIDLAAALLVAAVYAALALRLSPPITLFVIGSALAVAFPIARSIRVAREAGAKAQTVNRTLHKAVSEHVASIKTAKTYAITAHHDARFVALVDGARASGLDVAAGETDIQQRLEMGSTTVLAIAVFIGSQVFFMSPAVLLLLLYIYARLAPRLVMIYRHIQTLATLLPAFASVGQLERECLAAAEVPPGVAGEALDLADAICFEQVSFSYPNRTDTPAVDGLTLRIGQAATTAIVGPSGSGKTTVADLILGLLSPTGGQVLVDGRPLTRAHLAAWRHHVGYVAQDTFLFDDTIRGNLRWAKPDADDRELWESLRLASADEFVAGLPQALDTVVGDRGVRLSGGERQRIAIARAMLRQPRLLVLDEATSAVDAENERRIQQAIDRLQHRVTIVIIAHRLSTIRHADVIHVMDRGRVVQSGSWQSLMSERGGRFHVMARTSVDAIHDIA